MNEKGKRRRMRLVSVWIPRPIIEKMDRLVECGVFPSKSELIRYALMRYISELEERFQIRGKMLG